MINMLIIEEICLLNQRSHSKSLIYKVIKHQFTVLHFRIKYTFKPGSPPDPHSASSLLSPQLFSPSHSQPDGMHLEFPH